MNNEELILAALKRLEEKVDKHDAQFLELNTKMNKGFAALDAKIAALDAKVAALDAKVAALDAKVDKNFATLDAKIDKNFAENAISHANIVDAISESIEAAIKPLSIQVQENTEVLKQLSYEVMLRRRA